MMCIDDMLYEELKTLSGFGFLCGEDLYCDSSRYLMKESVTGCITERRFKSIHTVEELTLISLPKVSCRLHSAISFKLSK